MRYLWTEDIGAGLHFQKLVNQLFFDNELVVESKWSNQGLLDALIDLETEDGDEYFVAFDYVVDNQDMLSNVKWGKYIIGDLFEGQRQQSFLIKQMNCQRRSFLKRERRLKSFLKNEYFKVSLNEVSRDLRLSETLRYSKMR